MGRNQKVTVTLPIAEVETIRELVATGKADSVSGFVQHAVRVSLDDISAWSATLAQALQETGGDLTPAERAWGSHVLGIDNPPSVD